MSRQYCEEKPLLQKETRACKEKTLPVTEYHSVAI